MFSLGCSYNGSLAYYGKQGSGNTYSRPQTAKHQNNQNKSPQKIAREGYSIQVGAFKNADNAGRLAEYLDKRGLDAFLFREKDVYKVRFGNFKTRDEARARGNSLKKSGSIGEFFVVVPEDYSVAKAAKFKTGGDNYIRRELVNTAHQYIGVPYIWGGSTEAGFDCSGLTRAVYRLNGISIPRVSRDQYSYGKTVGRSSMKVGDLVFFATSGGRKVSHVGVYIGGNEFIHAPSKGKTVRIDRLDSSYWSKRYLGAKQYL